MTNSKLYTANIYILFSVLFLCTFIFSCTKVNTKAKNKNGTFEVCIDYGCTNPKKTVNCSDVIAFIQPAALGGGPNQQQIHIQGKFPDNSGVSLDLLWTGNPGNTTFNLNENNIGQGNWGYAVYYPVFGSSISYLTIDEGATGTSTITNYDNANQTISGTFSFKGKYFNGSDFENNFMNVSGSFSNIPIVDPNNPQSSVCDGSTNNGNSGGGGTGGVGGGNTNTFISFQNPTFTDINIDVDGVQKVIPVGSTVTFSGLAKKAFTMSATTSGKTSSGSQVGLQMQWNINGNYPSTGTSNTILNVTKDFFFLKMINNSTESFTKLYVNYGLNSQVLENINITNDGKTYNIGYYKAFSNSNVRAESKSFYYTWNPLNLTFSDNQYITLTAQ